jgi:hypothetical protein
MYRCYQVANCDCLWSRLSVRAHVYGILGYDAVYDIYHYFATIFRAKEYGGKMFLQNVGAVLPVCTLLKPRRLTLM